MKKWYTVKLFMLSCHQHQSLFISQPLPRKRASSLWPILLKGKKSSTFECKGGKEIKIKKNKKRRLEGCIKLDKYIKDGFYLLIVVPL